MYSDYEEKFNKFKSTYSESLKRISPEISSNPKFLVSIKKLISYYFSDWFWVDCNTDLIMTPSNQEDRSFLVSKDGKRILLFMSSCKSGYTKQSQARFSSIELNNFGEMIVTDGNISYYNENISDNDKYNSSFIYYSKIIDLNGNEIVYHEARELAFIEIDTSEELCKQLIYGHCPDFKNFKRTLSINYKDSNISLGKCEINTVFRDMCNPAAVTLMIAKASNPSGSIHYDDVYKIVELSECSEELSFNPYFLRENNNIKNWTKSDYENYWNNVYETQNQLCAEGNLSLSLIKQNSYC